MIFFTRRLYDGIQPDSGWERRALREWDKRSKFYTAYFHIISPLLPAAVRKLCRESLHDARVVAVQQRAGTLSLDVDAAGALSGFRGRLLRLTFRGVKRRPVTRGLVGQWWLYEEAHLCSRAAFSLHVLFERSELEIAADELTIERLARDPA